VQGTFFGAALPAAQIEARIAAHVPRKHIVEVADVYQARWWDYRRLTPGHAFYLFAHHYYKGSRFAARKFMSERPHSPGDPDRRKALAIVGPALVQMDASGIWERDQGHIVGLWNAMLVADAHGIPYPEFTRLACRIALDRMWKHVPRPNQLYSEIIAALVIDEWEQLCKERVYSASHPLYLEENYIGLQVQDDYREWIIKCIKAHSSPLNSLMQAIYVNRHIPEALALQHFPQQLITRARLLAA
jgi:hypothetical protein